MKIQDISQSVWASPSVSFPEHEEILVFDEKKNRIVLFVTFGTNPHQRGAMKLWYEMSEPSSLRTRLDPKKEEWTETKLDLDEDKLTLTTKLSQVFRRLPMTEYPTWLKKELREANLKMDLKEQ